MYYETADYKCSLPRIKSKYISTYKTHYKSGEKKQEIEFYKSKQS